MKSELKIAVVVIAYNRVDSLSRLLESLNNAIYGDNDDVELIISIDKSNKQDVEDFANGFKWNYGHKTVIAHVANLGLKKHILSQGELLDKYDAIVVFEDDLVVSAGYWGYVKQTVEKYKDDMCIAGISLYSYSVNCYKRKPFTPIKNSNDVFFMNLAMSWGQVWMRKQWKAFEKWYDNNKDFNWTDKIPQELYEWGDKSWLKYHMKYCIEENKYFVYPYVSYTTNFSEMGEHFDKKCDPIFQVPLFVGKTGKLCLPSSEDKSCVMYDGFYENKSLCDFFELSDDICCIDLNGINGNLQNKRYWLTTKRQNFSILKSYACLYRPIELNVLLENRGMDIYLYDTKTPAHPSFPKDNQHFLYLYKVQNTFFWLREYGWGNFIREFYNTIIFAIKRRVNK